MGRPENLVHELRPSPGDLALGDRLRIKWHRPHPDRIEPRANRCQRSIVKAAADITDRSQRVALPNTENERAEAVTARALAFGKAADHEFGGLHRLHLEPVVGAAARVIETRPALGQHPLEAGGAGGAI